MFGIFVLALTVGLVDSINPTTVVPAIYLATMRRARAGLSAYTLGVFSVYFLGGLLITLGPGQLILSIAPHPDRDVKHILEVCVGGVAGIAAIGVWFGRRRLQERVPKVRRTAPRPAFVLGASITAVELPTAFPYFAVIAAIIGSDLDLPVQVLALVVFNVAFVLPMLVMLAIREFGGDRTSGTLERFGDWFQRNSAILLAALLAIVAVAFIVVGTSGLAHGKRRSHGPVHGTTRAARRRPEALH